jgi:integrase/recombinase XerD
MMAFSGQQEEMKKARFSEEQIVRILPEADAGTNERMRAELAAYVAAHKPEHKTQRLFYTQRSEGFTANTLTHIINGIYSQAGIANASSHSGRRSGLTTLADKGVSVRVLMALTGHSQIATTQRYIDLRPSVVGAAVELV